MVPYSFKDVALGQRVAQSADRPTLLFFRHAPAHPCMPQLTSTHSRAEGAKLAGSSHDNQEQERLS